jgi:transposase-like protein
MKQYSEEFKSSIIAKMLPPNSIPVPDLARDTGVPKDTLYTWRIKHQRLNGNATAKQMPSGSLSSAEKFSVVMELASMRLS